MEDQVKKLKHERGLIKAALTRFKTFVDSTDATTNLEVLKARLEKFSNLYDKFDEIQAQIEAILIDPEHEEAHNSERSSFENPYFELFGTVQTLISRSQTREETPISIHNSSGNTPHSSQTISTVKLPELTLPTFDGTFEKWIKFRDTFDSLIHKNDSLSDIQKFHYLNSALKGTAAKSVEALGISELNYAVAWKSLQERFEDSKLLIQHHIRSLFDLPSIPRNSRETLRQVLDDTNNHILALKALGEPVEHWDSLLIHLIVTKLDITTASEWEKATSETQKLSKFKDLIRFLRNHWKYLEKTAFNKPGNSSRSSDKPPFKRHRDIFESRRDHSMTSDSLQKRHRSNNTQTQSYIANNKGNCMMCKGPHPIYLCAKFRTSTPEERRKTVTDLHLCYNCLRPGHAAKICMSSRCRKCGNKHNTSLHDSPSTPPPIVKKPQLSQPSTSTNAYLAHSDISDTQLVLLSTAIVYLKGKNGIKYEFRALLDSGSQSHFITERACRKLNLTRTRSNTCISGLGQHPNNSYHKTDVTIHSTYNDFNKTISCLVLPRITGKLPNSVISKESIPIPPNFVLADPRFYEPKEVDLLIGAGLFWELLCVGQHKIGPEYPLLQKTQLGWILAGAINSLNVSVQTHSESQLVTNANRESQSATNAESDCNLATNTDSDCCLVTNDELQKQLKSFWEIENCNTVQNFGVPIGNNICEEHFKRTTTRDIQGRYVLSIPFNNKIRELGKSKRLAKKRLFSIENKLNRDPELKTEYIKFLKEYEELGHMTEITEDVTDDDSPGYYLPHHPVIRLDSMTTKVRVVFDGSAKTTSGVSFNETQHIGPTVQDDLFSIIIRFRKHRYVLSADIAKMYRQLLIKPDERQYQKILWRTDTSHLIKTYQLNTVTYGTASAPFLATRALRDLGEQNLIDFPNAGRTIIKDFYVDDLLTGTNSIEEGRKLREDILTITKSAGLELRKWSSNEPKILKSDVSSNEVELNSESSKILGLLWLSKTDKLKYSIKNHVQPRITKRAILSAIAQIFDPLGLVGPIIIEAKIILQRLWQLKVSWDESLPQDIHTHWTKFQEELTALNSIVIPRHVICLNPTKIELHGFCDASQKAYGACIYIRSQNTDGSWIINLLCAKSRVAPLKTISLPRLELCGAVLLAQLAYKIKLAIDVSLNEEYYWCDSTITLAWIKGDSNRWKTFVANRTTEIQQLTNDNWNHVPSEENPADIISRGLNPAALQFANLWWNGPAWLSKQRKFWPAQNIQVSDIPECKKGGIHTLIAASNNSTSIFERYSSLNRLLRVVAYCFRFINNLRANLDKTKKSIDNQQGETARRPELSISEVASARNALIKLVQDESFHKEKGDIQRKGEISRTSPLNQLNPFLDTAGIIRVGGRLDNALIPYDQKHPIILPSKHHFTTLVIKQEHERLLHAGPQAVISSIRLKYWPLSIRNTVKKILRKCIKCFRVKPSSSEYIMGNLPASRVTATRPFSTCGVDYAGPLFLKEKTRSRTVLKAYICIFVCFTTKAVHIELATDLSSEAFLNCLRRFISRRGRPQNIYSDNGTNFVGAKNQLNELGILLSKKDHATMITNFTLHEGIQWHFMPPHAPNFGGLWESAVKSAKYHLRRVIGDTKLTFEEMYTILTQIEACMNSRPLCPLSNDPTDLTPLTPGHFLIGDSLSLIPESDLLDVPQNRLTRYQLLQQTFQHFWKRWQTEYLHQLQQRHKWRASHPPKFNIGSLVLMKDDNLPPMKWRLGRVTELHPGRDEVTRVVTIKTSDGFLKRPLTKICILPMDDQ